MYKQRNEELKAEIQAFKEHVAKRIKRLRSDRHVSQDEVAFTGGISRSHMPQIENDGLDLRLSTVFRLAKALEVEPWEILKFD